MQVNDGRAWVTSVSRVPYKYLTYTLSMSTTFSPSAPKPRAQDLRVKLIVQDVNGMAGYAPSGSIPLPPGSCRAGWIDGSIICSSGLQGAFPRVGLYTAITEWYSVAGGSEDLVAVSAPKSFKVRMYTYDTYLPTYMISTGVSHCVRSCAQLSSSVHASWEPCELVRACAVRPVQVEYHGSSNLHGTGYCGVGVPCSLAADITVTLWDDITNWWRLGPAALQLGSPIYYTIMDGVGVLQDDAATAPRTRTQTLLEAVPSRSSYYNDDDVGLTYEPMAYTYPKDRAAAAKPVTLQVVWFAFSSEPTSPVLAISNPFSIMVRQLL